MQVMELNEKTKGLLSEFRDYENFVTEQRNWYCRYATRSMLWFKMSIMATLVLSTSLPVIANLSDFPRKSLVLTIGPLLIAWIAGLNSLNQWQVTWGSRRKAESFLTLILLEWKLAIWKASQISPDEDMRKEACRVTEVMLTQTRQLLTTETEAFFALVEKLNLAKGKPE